MFGVGKAAAQGSRDILLINNGRLASYSGWAREMGMTLARDVAGRSQKWGYRGGSRLGFKLKGRPPCGIATMGGNGEQCETVQDHARKKGGERTLAS